MAWGWAILEGEGLGVGCWVGGDGVVKAGESYEGHGAVVRMELGEIQGVSMGMGDSQGVEGLARKFVASGVGKTGTTWGSVELKFWKVVSDSDTST